MQLTDDARDKLVAKLGDLWPEPRTCPACRQNTWSLSDRVFEIRDYFAKGIVLGGVPIIPVVVATCATCGYSMLFNAIALGLVKSEREPAKTDAPAADDLPKTETPKGESGDV